MLKNVFQDTEGSVLRKKYLAMNYSFLCWLSSRNLNITFKYYVIDHLIPKLLITD